MSQYRGREGFVKWALLGVVLVAALAGFAMWRASVLGTLPKVGVAPSASTSTLAPLAVEREALLQFESENLAARVKELGVLAPPTSSLAVNTAPTTTPPTLPVSTPAASSSPPSPTPQASTTPPLVAASSSASSSPSHASTTPVTSTSTQATSTPVQASTTPATSTSSATSTPAASAPPRQQFLIDGKGFCSYVRGNSSVVLSGYPLPVDMSIQDDNIKSWTDDRVVFWTPLDTPPGTYTATVRGVNGWGYCTAATSTPRMIVVK